MASKAVKSTDQTKNTHSERERKSAEKLNEKEIAAKHTHTEQQQRANDLCD